VVKGAAVLAMPLLALVVAGCAVIDARVPAPAARAAEFALPWQTLGGGWAPVPVRDAAAPAPPQRRIQLSFPVGVAVRGNDVVIADSGLSEVLRYDRARDTMLPAFGIDAPQAGNALALCVAADLSVFVADPADGVVRQRARDGRLVQVFRDEANLTHPIGVAFDEARGELLVADGRRAHIVVFARGGEPRGVRHVRGPFRFQSVGAIALGPDGLYVLDRAAQQVAVLGADGAVRAAFSDDSLAAPGVLAVDAARRVFVTDEADQTISVYAEGEPIARVGGRGSGPGRFGTITALAIDGNLLYVADSTRSRVHILLLAPESPRRPTVR